MGVAVGAFLVAGIVADARARGLPGGAPACRECHSIEDLTRETEDGREISIYVDEARLRRSVHGEVACVDCHRGIRDTHPDDGIRPEAVDCGRCHSRQSENAAAGIHARLRAAGEPAAPGCVDCHGSHDARSAADPESPLHWSNQGRFCGECHPAAAREFQESVHGAALARNVREAPGCGDCHFEHALEPGGRASSRRRSAEVCSRCHESERLNARFGLPRDRVRTFLESYHGLAVRRWLHRASAVVLLGLGFYHLYYLAATSPGRRLFRDLVPRRRDGADLATNLRHFLRRGSPRPVFARFSYPQKLEYWTVFWGVTVMGLTGLMLWFAVELAQWLPRWAIQVARTIHYYEALLAVLAVAVWHLYQVLFDPRVYPMNWAWWDGRVDADRYRRDHGHDPALSAPRRRPRPAPTRK